MPKIVLLGLGLRLGQARPDKARLGLGLGLGARGARSTILGMENFYL